jgi:hypothetical protein
MEKQIEENVFVNMTQCTPYEFRIEKRIKQRNVYLNVTYMGIFLVEKQIEENVYVNAV